VDEHALRIGEWEMKKERGETNSRRPMGDEEGETKD
jgi:hypothetical protein